MKKINQLNVFSAFAIIRFTFLGGRYRSLVRGCSVPR
jgi:hypothetical protein